MNPGASNPKPGNISLNTSSVAVKDGTPLRGAPVD